MSKTANIDSWAAVFISNIGISYHQLSSYSKALDYYHLALNEFYKQKNKRGAVSVLGSMGELYYILAQDSTIAQYERTNVDISLQKQFNLDNAISYSKDAEKILVEINDNIHLLETYKVLKNAYKEKGAFKNAFIYLEKLKKLQDSVFSADKISKVDSLEANYQNKLAEREAIIAALKAEEEESYRNNIQYSSVAIFILILLILIFVFTKFNLPITFLDGMVLITFLLFYELILIITEPWVDDWTHDIPIYKLLINFAIALLFIPFHSLEKKLRLRYKNI